MAKTKLQKLQDAGKIIQEASKLIEAGWCRNNNARAANNEEVEAEDPRAVKFCAIGSVVRATKNLGLNNSARELAISILDQTVQKELENEETTIMDYNDERSSKKPVLRMFAKAFERTLAV